MEFDRVTFDLPNGTFHALSGGDPEGRPLLFLHGFPDHPPTAEPFLAELCDRGHRVLAPWLRGYAPSPLRGPFNPPSLAGDAIALIDRWSPDRAVDIVGHDWGGTHTYFICGAAPDRIARAVTLAIPHPLTFLRQLRSPAQMRQSWYLAFFQLPGAARLAAAQDFALIDRLWRQWSPGFELDPARRAELHACLAASMPAPVTYYRQFLLPARAPRARVRALARPIATPLLQLHGADDGCILPPRRDDHDRFAGEYSREIVPGVGHFLHLEDPTGIAERVSAWLADD